MPGPYARSSGAAVTTDSCIGPGDWRRSALIRFIRYPGSMVDIASNLQRVRDEIAEAALKTGRNPDEITLLAVSKTFPAGAVIAAAAAGQQAFGENRVQEGAGKVVEVDDSTLQWHLIGHLQSNKSRLAATRFDVVQTVDSLKLARRLSSHCEELGRHLQVYLQINLGDETQKSGLHISDVAEVAASISCFTAVV